jgi:RNA polymerase sigma factor (TIGR02999 family)
MTDPGNSQITQILEAIGAGDDDARDELIPLVYKELRKMAGARMARERPGQTLQPTALVHEAFLRLFGKDKPNWENRGHFFGAAAEAMRRILIERARSKARLMRGGDRQRVELESGTGRSEPSPLEVLAVDEALTRLEAIDERMAQVVKLRYFAGLTLEEVAAALDVSLSSVNRLWSASRAWLQNELQTHDPQV